MPYIARTYQIKQSLLYHIYNRGNAKNEIFHSEEDYRYFLELLKSYSHKNNVGIYHWALMPNHYHLLAELVEPAKLSSIMAGIGRSYVHYYHRKYLTVGHLFQGRFKSQPVQRELYLLACGRYIERNPVVAGLSASAEKYSYSSAHFYVYGKDDGLTREDPLFQTFGEELFERRKVYAAFLRDFNKEEEKIFENFESPCGSKEFSRRLIKEKGLYVPRNGRPVNEIVIS
jgi:putative transposase